MTVRFIAAAVAIVLGAVALAGCGGSDAEELTYDETEAVVLDGLTYRVSLFRELNRNIDPDGQILDGAGPPANDSGYYAAFVNVCNETDAELTPTSDVVLQDAFGEEYQPMSDQPDFAYRPATLEPGQCQPAEGTLAERGLPGAPVVFEIAFEQVDQRPLSLVLGGDQGSREIELDL